MSNNPQGTNPLGNASLALGVASAALVFGIGLCAWTGVAQNWIRLAGLFRKDRPRATVIVGLIHGLIGACMFFAFLSAVGNAGV